MLVGALVNREFKKISHIDDSEDKPNEHRHVPAPGVVKQARMRERHPPLSRFKFTSVCGEHVLNPVRVASIGERNDEAIIAAKHHYRSVVLTPGFPPNVDDYSHSWSPSGERSKNSVGNVQIETRDPSRYRHRGTQALMTLRLVALRRPPDLEA